MHGDAEVEELLADHPDPVAATARRLRAVLLEGRPELVERVRRGWHSLNYAHPAAGYVCGLFPGADVVQLVFEHGVLLPDLGGRLTGSGRRVRSLEFRDATEVDAPVVLEFLDLAVELGAGLRAGG